MSDELIIIQQETIDVLKRIRSPKIIIKNPESGNKTITYQVAEAEYRNNTFVNEEIVHSIHKELTLDVMLSDITFTDPITQQQITLKVATVAKAIEQYFINEYLKQTNSVISELPPSE